MLNVCCQKQLKGVARGTSLPDRSLEGGADKDVYEPYWSLCLEVTYSTSLHVIRVVVVGYDDVIRVVVVGYDERGNGSYPVRRFV